MGTNAVEEEIEVTDVSPVEEDAATYVVTESVETNAVGEVAAVEEDSEPVFVAEAADTDVFEKEATVEEITTVTVTEAIETKNIEEEAGVNVAVEEIVLIEEEESPVTEVTPITELETPPITEALDDDAIIDATPVEKIVANENTFVEAINSDSITEKKEVKQNVEVNEVVPIELEESKAVEDSSSVESIECLSSDSDLGSMESSEHPTEPESIKPEQSLDESFSDTEIIIPSAEDKIDKLKNEDALMDSKQL